MKKEKENEIFESAREFYLESTKKGLLTALDKFLENFTEEDFNKLEDENE